MKEEDLKIKKKKMKKSTFFEKPKILHFYWNKNLNSGKFWKIFFGSEVMGNSLEVILAKTPLLFAVFYPPLAQKF